MNSFCFFSYPINTDVISGYSAALEKIINQLNPSFILCVIKSERNNVYNLIKQYLCVKRAGTQYYYNYI